MTFTLPYIPNLVLMLDKNELILSYNQIYQYYLHSFPSRNVWNCISLKHIIWDLKCSKLTFDKHVGFVHIVHSSCAPTKAIWWNNMIMCVVLHIDYLIKRKLTFSRIFNFQTCVYYFTLPSWCFSICDVLIYCRFQSLWKNTRYSHIWW